MRALFRIGGALFRLLGVIAVALIGILVGVIVALQFDWAREGLKDTILANLNNAISGRVEIDRLGGTLPFSVELEGVRIFDPDGVQVVSVRNLSTSIRVLGLLDRQVDVSSLALTEPSVTIFDGEGRIGLARAFAPRSPSPATPDAPSEPGQPWVIRVRSIALETARIEGVVPGEDVDLFNLALSVGVTIDGKGVHWRDLRVSSNVFTSEGLGWINDGGGISIVSDGSLGSDSIVLKRFELQLGPQAIALSGDLDLTGQAGGDLVISGIKLDTRAWAMLPPQLRGDLEAEGRLTVRNDSVAVAIGVRSDVGDIALQAGADVNVAKFISGTEALEVGDWSLHLDAAHLRATDFLAVTMGGESTVGFSVDLAGRGLPTDSQHALEGTLEIQGLAVDGEAGKALVTVRHLPGADGVEPGWIVDMQLGKLDLQPWLGYADLPKLAGVVDGARIRGLVTLRQTDQGLVPTLALSGGLRLEAAGTIPFGDGEELVKVKQLLSNFQLQWDGEGLPEVAVFVSADELSGLGIEADFVKARVFSVTQSAVGLALNGAIEGRNLSYGGIRVGALNVPLEGRVVMGDDGGVRLSSATLEPDVDSLKMVDGTGWRHLKGSLRLDERDSGHRLHGRLAVTHLVAGPAIVEATELALDLSVPRVDGPGLIEGRSTGTLSLAMKGVDVVTGPSEHVRLSSASVEAAVVWPRGLLGPMDVSGRMTLLDFVGSGTRIATTELSYGALISPSRRELSEIIKDAQIMAELSDIAFTDSKLLANRPIKSAIVRSRMAADGRMPLELSVELDERYAFKTLAEVRLPTRRSPLSGAVEAFQLSDRKHDRAIVSLDGAILSPEGIVSISGLTLLGPNDGSGRVSVGGYLDLKQQEIDANIDLIDLDLGAFFDMASEIIGTSLIPSTRVGGLIQADIDIYGDLKAPTLALTLKLERGTLNDGTGLTADVKIDAVPTGVTGSIDATWREGGGHLALAAELPGKWSLDPIGIVWDESRPMAVDVTIDEPDLAATAKTLKTLLGLELAYPISGALSADLKIGGRPGAATTDFRLKTENLEFNGYSDANIQVAIGTTSPDTNIDIITTRQNGDVLGRVQMTLPFTLVRAAMQADPVAYVHARILAEPLSAVIELPFTTIGETPLGAFVPFELKALGIGSDLRFEGTLDQPNISGSVDVSGLEMMPEASVTRLELATELDALRISATVFGGDGTLWIDGDLRVPGISRIAQNPERAIEVLSDPGFTAEIFTADLPTFDFWRILPEVGDPASQFMPDGSLMVTVNVHGGPEGPTANVLARLRTHTTPTGRDSDSEPRARAGLRNVANDILITARMTPTEAVARVLMLQEPASHASPAALTPMGHEHLGVELSLELGTVQLLSGAPLALEQLQVHGNIDAMDFRLAGLAATMRSLLGSTTGALHGRIDVSGTVGRPKFSGGLVLRLADLAIAPIGLRRENVELKLSFDDSNTVTLEGLEFEEEADEGDKPARMDFKLAATIEALDAARITIDGAVSWWRFPVVARKDAAVRMSGEITLAGTVAKPKISGSLEVDKAELSPSLSSRSVRAVGLPAGVTLVRGDPKPPTEVAVKDEFRTEADIDVSVHIPTGSTHLEPALFLAVGEVRAVLEPHTGGQPLYIRTSQGRLGIFGTIYVPKEHVQVYGKKFVIDEDSRIIFTGDMDTDPQLRITARYNISHIDLSTIGLVSARDSSVGIKISGNAVDPGITFVSDPRMDEGNMLSIIALGTPSGGGDAIASQARGQLLSAFLSMATLELGRGLTETLPIEVLKLDTLTGDNDLRLTVGKRITDDLYIYYRSEWGGTRRTNTVWAEYRLGRLLYVSAEYGDNANPERPAETSVRASVRITP